METRLASWWRIQFLALWLVRIVWIKGAFSFTIHTSNCPSTKLQFLNNFHHPSSKERVRSVSCDSLRLAVVTVEVSCTVTIHSGDETRRRVPHGLQSESCCCIQNWLYYHPIEVMSGALSIKNTRRSVIEEARREVGNAKHLQGILSQHLKIRWFHIRVISSLRFLILVNFHSTSIIAKAIKLLNNHRSSHFNNNTLFQVCCFACKLMQKIFNGEPCTNQQGNSIEQSEFLFKLPI